MVQQNLATNWSRVVVVVVVQQPFKKILHYAKVREVRDFHNNVSVCNLQRIEEAHSILSDVDDRQQAFRQQSCENTELSNYVLPITTSL